jgi:hypothetical protein
MAGSLRPGVARGGDVRSLKRRRRLKKRMAFFPPSTVSVSLYAVPK